VFNLRFKKLTSGIKQLLDPQPGKENTATEWFLNKFWEHPLIAGMRKQKDDTPGNVPRESSPQAAG
jgi:hypothetical protein